MIHGSGCSAELVMSCFGLNVSSVWMAAHVCVCVHTLTGKRGEKKHTVFIRGTNLYAGSV